MATNLFFVMHASNQMFWEMVKISRYYNESHDYKFRMLSSWRNSRNEWFRKVLNGADHHNISSKHEG